MPMWIEGHMHYMVNTYLGTAGIKSREKQA